MAWILAVFRRFLFKLVARMASESSAAVQTFRSKAWSGSSLVQGCEAMWSSVKMELPDEEEKLQQVVQDRLFCFVVQFPASLGAVWGVWRT